LSSSIPVVRHSDRSELWEQLRKQLVLRPGTPARELVPSLRIAQASFSRLVSRHADSLLVTGKGRSTRYALRRAVFDLGDRVPLFEIDEHGTARKLATMHAVTPGGYYVEAHAADIDDGFHGDLPYFIEDLRPSGFLGRLVPLQHPELGFPADVRMWSGDQSAAYLSRFGWNGSGALILGDAAFKLYLEHSASLPSALAEAERGEHYASVAEDVLRAGAPGSSAGGEQPKFLVTRAGGQHLLVKFSPAGRAPAARRIADLLVAEHLAHEVLRRHGVTTPRSRILRARERTFLEVERFDRTHSGRRGLVSLLALDAEFVGDMRSWSHSVARLATKQLVPPGSLERVRWLEAFGHLIANTDMHPANVSFLVRGVRVLDLAPVYDMQPALYAPQQSEIIERKWSAPVPEPSAASYWSDVCGAAEEYWAEVAHSPHVSADFRAISSANASKVTAARALAARLPT
jgi:hypothetical protein